MAFLAVSVILRVRIIATGYLYFVPNFGQNGKFGYLMIFVFLISKT